MHVLCVAEKPSIAKSITQILSGGQFTTRQSPNRFTKNYDFAYPQTRDTFTVTSVAGHLMDHDFDQAHHGWKSCDPFALFDAPVISKVKKDAEGIAKNLTAEAKKAQKLMIWTDCDREGENIGAEIAHICRQARRTIIVKRARFSAIIAQQIHNAAQHPVELDWAQSNAVEARIYLDLRIGASFTRLQTLSLQDRFQQLSSVISYGPCQFPALGFVVARYNKVKAFRSEPFWYIHLALDAQGSSEETEEIVFTWRRGHIFDELIASAIYLNVMDNPKARVMRVTQKNTKKFKPLPLTTVDLQKAGSRLLKISPKKVLDIAESLYQQGFLSYPRTETDQYDPAFDFDSLVGKQTADGAWGVFAASLQNGGFQAPRKGKKNDKAHPPIHPTAYAGNLAGDDKKVYEYITRRFLASCSKDALGWETTVDILCGGEEFYATGLVILERNYLEVFPYDKWSGKELPNLEQGQEFTPSACNLKDGRTTRPNLLTEADLVSEMDKNGIGTDATIAQHIQTIIDRQYVIEHMQGATKYLVPSTLGVGLVEGYNEIGFDRSLSKPELRRATEREMVQICEGTKSKEDMLTENIERYKEMYVKTKRDFARIAASVGNRLGGNEIDYDLDLGDEAFGGGGNGGGGGEGGRGGGSGPPSRGRGSRGARGAGKGPASAPSSRRGRGGGRGGAPAPQGDDDDANPPPPPAPRGRPPSSRSAPKRTSTGVICDCGVPAAEQATADGRRYWTCGNNGACQIFQFMDGPSRQVAPQQTSGRGNGTTSTASRSTVSQQEVQKRCQCDKEAILLVTKNGVNVGRKFWKCQGSTCSYFEWAAEGEVDGIPTANDGGPGVRGANAGGQGEGSGACFKCGQEGHWANDCPNGDAVSNPNRPNLNGGSSSSRACFKCGQEGHFSNACPDTGPQRSKSFGTNGAAQSPLACFRCGKNGHFSNACPRGGTGSSKPQANTDITCFKCQQPGHYSNACPSTGTKKRTSSTSSTRGRKARGRGGSSTRGRGRRRVQTSVAPNESADFMDEDDGFGDF